MYRNTADQTIVYTSEDIVLFRESPFAAWMERLSLENREHGIPHDVGSVSPSDAPKPEDVLSNTLRAEGKDVIAIEWGLGEAERRTATLAAMRHGVDFIVNGQLAVGPLSDSATLLMRTSGYSELGSYLYIPCDTQFKTTLASTFRLCFLADLLHSLQGQLPPQMLILRGESDVVPLQSEDHIYHYRAVKQRFMTAQSAFKNHRMPDPVESAHFGRWSDCANELLKQRALGEGRAVAGEEENEELLTSAVASSASGVGYDLHYQGGAAKVQVYRSAPRVQASGTLVEQASMLSPEAGLAPAPVGEESSLSNLEFIGSSQTPPTIGQLEPSAPSPQNTAYAEPPPANLRNPTNIDMDAVSAAKPRPVQASQPNEPFSDSLITNRES